jgi:hypothetical protein
MKHYYAGYSYMGVDMSYDSPCWTVYGFNSKAEREAWLKDNKYKDGNIVAEAITQRIAYKIAGVNAHNRPVIGIGLPHLLSTTYTYYSWR